MSSARNRFLAALITMPDEAFAWLVLASQPQAMTHGGNAQIWPDGTGGFMPASRVAIAAVQAAAADYLKGDTQA